MSDSSTPPTEPGLVGDCALGFPGPAEPMPIDEEQREEAILINEDDEEVEGDGHTKA